MEASEQVIGHVLSPSGVSEVIFKRTEQGSYITVREVNMCPDSVLDFRGHGLNWKMQHVPMKS